MNYWSWGWHGNEWRSGDDMTTIDDDGLIFSTMMAPFVGVCGRVVVFVVVLVINGKRALVGLLYFAFLLRVWWVRSTYVLFVFLYVCIICFSGGGESTRRACVRLFHPLVAAGRKSRKRRDLSTDYPSPPVMLVVWLCLCCNHVHPCCSVRYVTRRRSCMRVDATRLRAIL